MDGHINKMPSMLTHSLYAEKNNPLTTNFMFILEWLEIDARPVYDPVYGGCFDGEVAWPLWWFALPWCLAFNSTTLADEWWCVSWQWASLGGAEWA